jgi:hypothetical protein
MSWDRVAVTLLQLGAFHSDTLRPPLMDLLSLLPPSPAAVRGVNRMPAGAGRPRTDVQGPHGLFVEIHAVDPETRTLPDGASPFAAAPRRPGAPVYSALYFGLRIGLSD